MTDAGGTAVVRLSEDGTALHYRLIVRKIEAIFGAHIHLAPAGSNGPVVAFLFAPAGPTGSVNGVIAEGTITASDLRGPLAGQSVADLAAAISAGNTYVNVHTLMHPPGEVRGQIQ